MQMNATDLSARLLATENLSVVRARTRTASFDIKSRVLTLPMWKEMTPEIEDMLVGHEVGHALYTSDQYIDPIRENPKLMGYMNIIEDVRIEKLIKRKYPGLRKRMNEGYKQLNDRDFFGAKTIQNFDDVLLIDKINLYFKVGFNCGVTFTPVEKQFVNRAERTETVDEVIALAQEIYAYSKEQSEERKQRLSEEEQQEEEEIESDFEADLDGEWEEQEEESDQETLDNNNPSSGSNDSQYSDDLESKTERSFRTRLEDLADESTEYKYWAFDHDFLYDPVVGYKKILSETLSPEQWDESQSYDYTTRYMNDVELKQYRERLNKEFQTFKTDSLRTVNYLVKEFEMKKSAQLYKRAKVAKVGSLDMRRAYAYQIKDDIFKRVTTLPQGKNHGMVMLVDWSGSMNNVLADTLKQVINLAMFCQRVQIPFRVYAFTTSYEDDLHTKMSADDYHEMMQARYAAKRAKLEANPDVLNTANNFHLLELFSSKMTTSEFNSMARRVIDYRFTWNKGYNTGGTPLTEALVWCYNNLGEFIKSHNIEKTTFITLTDGEGCGLSSIGGGRIPHDRVDYSTVPYKRIRIKNLLKDDLTKKTYELGVESSKQTDVVLSMIKDRYNASLIGFHVVENRRRDLMTAINSNIPGYRGDVYSLIETWRKSFRDQSFASIKNTSRDELFIIPQSSTRIVEGELEVNADAKASSIAKSFGKYLNVKKTSRVLLNRFVTLVA